MNFWLTSKRLFKRLGSLFLGSCTLYRAGYRWGVCTQTDLVPAGSTESWALRAFSGLPGGTQEIRDGKQSLRVRSLACGSS